MDIFIGQRFTVLSLDLYEPRGLWPEIHGINHFQILAQFSNLTDSVEILTDLLSNLAFDVDIGVE
jgi:hypothetical protein